MKKQTIGLKQNSIEALKMLIVQRRTHSYAKRWNNAYILIVVILPVVAYSLKFFNVDISSVIALITIISIILEVVLFNPCIKDFKEKAINVQEQFDDYVFGLKWPTYKFNTKVLYNAECKLSPGQIDDNVKKEKLKNWYVLPLKNNNILYCQKQNLNYSETLRKDLQMFNVTSSIVIIIVTVLICYFSKNEFGECLVDFVIPVVPVLKWLLNNSIVLENYMKRLLNVVSKIEMIERKMVNININQEIQSEIIELRRMAPFVPDWYYKLRRDEIEKSLPKKSQGKDK